MKKESNLHKSLFLFWTFFKGMTFAFTGGMAALPIVERDIVQKKKWLSEKEFWTFPALGQSLPGVIGIHNSMLIGNRVAGPLGAFMAAMGVISPAFLSMLIIAAAFQAIVENPYVRGVIRGIRAVAVAIILGVAARLIKTAKKDPFTYCIILGSVITALFFNVSAFTTIIVCGILGILAAFLFPHFLDEEQKPGSEQDEEE